MIENKHPGGPVTISISIPEDVFYKIEEERAEMERKTGIQITRSAYIAKRLKEQVSL